MKKPPVEIRVDLDSKRSIEQQLEDQSDKIEEVVRMATGNVVPLHTEGEQTSFDGFPISESRYSLKSKPLASSEELRLFQNVTITGSGRIVGVQFREMGEQQLKRVFVVEILEARLTQ